MHFPCTVDDKKTSVGRVRNGLPNARNGRTYVYRGRTPGSRCPSPSTERFGLLSQRFPYRTRQVGSRTARTTPKEGPPQGLTVPAGAPSGVGLLRVSGLVCDAPKVIATIRASFYGTG